MQRLVRNISFPTECAIAVSDISEHCNEEFGLTFPRTKSESDVSNLVSDTSAFDFPLISWSPLTSKPRGEDFQHLHDPNFPTLTAISSLLNSTCIRGF